MVVRRFPEVTSWFLYANRVVYSVPTALLDAGVYSRVFTMVVRAFGRGNLIVLINPWFLYIGQSVYSTVRCSTVVPLLYPLQYSTVLYSTVLYSRVLYVQYLPTPYLVLGSFGGGEVSTEVSPEVSRNFARSEKEERSFG